MVFFAWPKKLFYFSAIAMHRSKGWYSLNGSSKVISSVMVESADNVGLPKLFMETGHYKAAVD